MFFSFLKKAPLAALLFISQILWAQQPGSGQPISNGIEMADRLRADGKIWVVVLVIAVVFAGIVIYLIRLDRQVSKLEKDIQERKFENVR